MPFFRFSSRLPPGRTYFTERYHGSFERQAPLGDQAEESFNNGVLTISVPKSDKPREGVKRIDGIREREDRESDLKC